MSTNNAIGILSVGHYLPNDPVSNDHFVNRGLDTSPEWIETRSGIITRHIAADNQHTSDLAVLSAQRALDAWSGDQTQLDFIIVATATPDHQGFPSTACLVQQKLQFDHPIEAFDITAACSGFAYALSIAYAKINAGLSQYGLIIGAETLSRLVDWSDRRTCILFGDGAGSAIVGPVSSGGFIGFNQGADGQASDILCCTPQPHAEQFSGSPYPAATSMIQMDGQAVFKKGTQVVVQSLRELMATTGIAIDAIDHVVCHQANRRILASVAKQLGIPFDKFIINIDRVGNTSAASIPLALCDAVGHEKIQPGDTVILVGFGAGFTWSSILLEWS